MSLTQSSCAAEAVEDALLVKFALFAVFGSEREDEAGSSIVTDTDTFGS